MKACEISKESYRRGYGTAAEMGEIRHQQGKEWVFDVSHYLNLKPEEKERRPR